MDAIYSPAWSPDGSKLLFSGIKDGKLDVFTIEIKTGELLRLTNDFFLMRHLRAGALTGLKLYLLLTDLTRHMR